MNNYLTAIKTGIYLFPIIALFFTFFFIIDQYHKYGSVNILRVIIIYSFILYLIIIYFLVILPLPKWNEIKPFTFKMIRLIPFTFISDFIKETSFRINDLSTYIKAITEPCFYIVILNIFMTMPFGMYLNYYFKCNIKKTIIISFFLSLFFELTQLTGLYFIYKGPYRLFDVDDLILNTLGGVLGYHSFNIIKKYLPSREEIDRKSKLLGQKVSGLRRITTFCLDVVLLELFKIIFNLFIIKIPNFLAFLGYYFIIPVILKGQTLGSKFLNVKISFPNNNYLKLTIHYLFLYTYYLDIPLKLTSITIKIINYLNLSSLEEISLYLIFLLLISLFYLINCIIIIKKRKTYYDDFLEGNYQSTINDS